MAEYIDREKLIPDRCYYELQGYEAISCEQIFHEDVANVVGREKYDELKSDYKLSVEAHKQSIKLYNKKVKELEDLKSKIDKAIKEMERYSTAFEYANKHDLASAVDYCIWVIQENIGE